MVAGSLLSLASGICIALALSIWEMTGMFRYLIVCNCYKYESY